MVKVIYPVDTKFFNIRTIKHIITSSNSMLRPPVQWSNAHPQINPKATETSR